MAAARLHRIAPALLTALALLGAGAMAHASPMEGRLERARKHYGDQEYEQVIRSLTPVVQSPLATISDKVAAYELLGLAYLILGDHARARSAFENLLGLDPGHELHDPSGSPKLKRFYESVKESFVPGYRARAKVSLEHAAPRRAVAGRRVEFAASVVRGHGNVASVALRWRRGGLLTYRSVPLRGDGRRLAAEFVLPADSSPYKLEYYLEARGEDGAALARVGSPGRPLSVRVGAGRRTGDGPSILSRWWFWTAVGVVVVGGVTAGVVVSQSDKAPSGTLGPTIQLR